MNIGSLEGHDLDAVFSNGNLIGHHIEFDDGANLSCTLTQSTKGNQINFKQSLNVKQGLTKRFINAKLFEDYSHGGSRYKVLKAQTEVDLYKIGASQLMNNEGSAGS